MWFMRISDIEIGIMSCIFENDYFCKFVDRTELFKRAPKFTLMHVAALQ